MSTVKWLESKIIRETQRAEYAEGRVRALLLELDKKDAALRRAKAEGMREADDIAGDHSCETWAECCDCASVIAREIRARAAQIEEGE